MPDAAAPTAPLRVGRPPRSSWLALLTLGEGWHNNHHFYPGSARQGFRWWEIDLTYYVLRLMAECGLVRDLKPVPARVLAQKSGGGRPSREHRRSPRG
jgi:fatty-acid desaturase